MIKYKSQLEDDPIVHAHLDTLYDNLLEHNLCRIIEPFSKVQVLGFSIASRKALFSCYSNWCFVNHG